MVTQADIDRAFRPTTRENSVGTLTPMPVTAGGVTGGARQSQSTANQTSTQSRTVAPALPRRSLSPTATNSSNSASARVNRALAIRQSMGGVQGNRASVESGANEDLAEGLRLNLIAQERMRKNMQAPGSVSSAQFRAMQAEMAANQNAINSGVEALNSIRSAQVTRAGQLTDAETTLQDRAMSEAGAFDRASLNLDVADIQGRYGLGRQALANQGAVDAAQAIDPLEMFALRSMQNTREQFATRGTPEEQARLAISQENAALGLQALADPTAGQGLEEVEFVGGDGLPRTVKVTPATAQRIGEYTAMRNNPGAWGLTIEDVERHAEALIAGTMTPADIAQQKALQQQQRNPPARPSRVATEPPQRQGM